MTEHETTENDAAPCNVCGESEDTFEAGGSWWCVGCAAFITEVHVEEDARVIPPGEGREETP